MPNNKFFRENKKVLIETWYKLEASKDDYEEELAHMALMENTKAFNSR